MFFPEDPEYRWQLYRCADALSLRWRSRMVDAIPLLRELSEIVAYSDDVEVIADALSSDAPLKLSWGPKEGNVFPLLVDGAEVARIEGPPRKWVTPFAPKTYAALLALRHEPSRDPFVLVGPPW